MEKIVENIIAAPRNTQKQTTPHREHAACSMQMKSNRNIFMPEVFFMRILTGINQSKSFYNRNILWPI